MRQSNTQIVLRALALVLLALNADVSRAQTSQVGEVPEVYSYSTGERLRDYVSRTAGPEALVNSALLAGLDQWRDTPEAWEQGGSGYGKRFASRLGRTAVGNTIQLGVEALLHEDSRYKPLERGGVGMRIGYSLSHTFTVMTPSGRRPAPIGRLAGIFGGSILSHRWYPDGENGIEDGARGGAISLGVYTGMNVFREFLPDIKRIFKKK